MTTTARPPDLRFLSRQEIAELTGHSLPTVDTWLYHDDPELRLPSYRPGGGKKILIRLDEFEEWLARHRTDRPHSRIRA